MNIEIQLPIKLVKVLMWISQFFRDERFVVVCKGYNDDWEMYTSLDWVEDKKNDLTYYEDFKLWINLI